MSFRRCITTGRDMKFSMRASGREHAQKVTIVRQRGDVNAGRSKSPPRLITGNWSAPAASLG